MQIFDVIVLAQAGSGSLIEAGLIDLPFPWVAAIVGVFVTAILLYFARRLAGDEPEE